MNTGQCQQNPPIPDCQGVITRWFFAQSVQTGNIPDIHAKADRGKMDVVGSVHD
jgi:hypothetical protein